MLISVYLGNVVEEGVQNQNRTIRSILDEDIVYNKTDDTDYDYDDVDNKTDTTTGHDLDPPPPRSAHQFMQPKSLVSFDNVYF